MTPAELATSADTDGAPPCGLEPLVVALWHARRCRGSAKDGHWVKSHEIAQDIHTAMGSWVHALLHLIEGDQWNADYWFSRAGKPSRKPRDVEALWMEIAEKML
jgi:hypothetical protein